MARWRTSFLGAASLYTRAAIQTRELLAALHAAGVRVIPLKGVWLAERVYEDGACRPMCDMDLLVPIEELPLARAAIERLGYTTPDYYLSETKAKHMHYQRPGGPLPLELHWHLWHAHVTAVGEPDLAQVWTGLQEELLHGVPVLVFPPERQGVFLVHHILHHTLAVPLKAYLDLILLCHRYAPQFDLARLNDEARAWQVAFGAKFVLQVACDIFKVRPPAPLASFLSSGCGGDEARSAALRAALQLNSDSRQITTFLEAFYHATGFRRLRLGLARMLLSPVEIRSGFQQVVRRWGLAAGYLWRCGDLLRRHGHAVRRVTSDGKAPDANLANFASRQTLSAWILEQEPRAVVRQQ
jgi:hypothetical protein